MELKNKKINFLGDSITEGHGTSGDGYRFVDLVKEMAGLAEARNYGIGGTRIARQQHPGNPVFDQDFILRTDRMDPDADVIVVFGGTNDFGHGDAPFGEFTDRTPDTFSGALHVLYNKLIERYPDAEIVILTPLHRGNEDNPHGDNWNKTEGVEYGPLKRYVDRIRETAEYYSLPVLDLWSMGKLQTRTDIIREKYMPDGLHPNNAGHRIIAERICNFLYNL